jgi:hypothetical protein
VVVIIFVEDHDIGNTLDTDFVVAWKFFEDHGSDLKG